MGPKKAKAEDKTDLGNSQTVVTDRHQDRCFISICQCLQSGLLVFSSWQVPPVGRQSALL